jgi:hypothetical protein
MRLRCRGFHSTPKGKNSRSGAALLRPRLMKPRPIALAVVQRCVRPGLVRQRAADSAIGGRAQAARMQGESVTDWLLSHDQIEKCVHLLGRYF